MSNTDGKQNSLKPGDLVMLTTSAAAFLWNSPFGTGFDNQRYVTGELVKGETAMFIAYNSTNIDVLVLAPGPKLGWIWTDDLGRV